MGEYIIVEKDLSFSVLKGSDTLNKALWKKGGYCRIVSKKLCDCPEEDECPRRVRGGCGVYGYYLGSWDLCEKANLGEDVSIVLQGRFFESDHPLEDRIICTITTKDINGTKFLDLTNKNLLGFIRLRMLCRLESNQWSWRIWFEMKLRYWSLWPW